MNVRYHPMRRVAATDKRGRPAKICMVQIELPDGGITSLAINERELFADCHGDKAREEVMIQRKVVDVVRQITAGACGDMKLLREFKGA